MKTLFVFSSQTGNTEKICRAAAEVLPGCAIFPVEDAPAPEGYDLVAVGFWVDRGMPDTRAKAYLEGIRHARVALLGTLGAWPDSEHAQECRTQAEALLSGRDNVVAGSFLCQGKVDPRVVEMMQKVAAREHPMTEERKARLAEAAKHPDEQDCENARAFMRAVVAQLTD